VLRPGLGRALAVDLGRVEPVQQLLLDGGVDGELQADLERHLRITRLVELLEEILHPPVILGQQGDEVGHG
jgi:hypothetical protein